MPRFWWRGKRKDDDPLVQTAETLHKKSDVALADDAKALVDRASRAASDLNDLVSRLEVFLHDQGLLERPPRQWPPGPPAGT